MKSFTAAFFWVCMLCLSFFSCSSGFSSGIFAEKLDTIDAFIAAEDYSGAWKLLKKNSKQVCSYTDYLSLVRRALILDKNAFAEKQMRKALLIFKDNQELLAVYTHFLISLKRYDEALRYAPKLEGGNYGSLYAELRFRIAGSENNPADFLSPAYIQAYIDSAATTGNSAYLRNAALIYALAGDMHKAFSLHPGSMSVYDLPEFWARISYDSGNFIQCAEDLQFAKPSALSSALSADALLRSGDERAAVLAWIDSTERFPSANAAAWYNASRAALRAGSVGYAYFFLTSLVRIFPDYVPGLTAYGRFSVYRPAQVEDHIFSGVLKERGVKTLSMELADVVPRINPEEALLRMEKSLERKEDAQLVLEHLKLQWQVCGMQAENAAVFTEKKKAADVWKLLEKSSYNSHEYKSFIVRFALWYFCRCNMIDEACELFGRWLSSRYAAKISDAPKDSKVLSPVIPFREDWEYDIGSYIALRQGRYDSAEALLRAAGQNKNITMPVSSLLNLALIYSGSSRRIQALDLYKTALERDTDKKLQAEIYYKMALIQREQKENRRALLSLNQALALDPGHSRSRFMLKQLDALAD